VAGLGVLLAVFWAFGLEKARLGVDFTDEGFYLAAPLRLHLGDRLYSSELVTLTRTFEPLSYVVMGLWPAATLFDFRMIGWLVHLAAFAAASVCCFRLSRMPWLSLIIPAVPLFASNAFVVTTPSYNTLSSDCLLLALCLRVIAAGAGPGPARAALVASGALAFEAILCFPPLVAVFGFLAAADGLAWLRGRGKARLAVRSPIAASLSLAVFCAGFLAYLIASGAAVRWHERIPLISGYLLTAFRAGPAAFVAKLFLFLVSGNRLLAGYAAASALLILALAFPRDPKGVRRKMIAGAMLAATAIGFISVYLNSREFLVQLFCLSAIACAAAAWAGLRNIASAVGAPVGAAIVASLLASLAFACSSVYFGMFIAWHHAAFGLPFCFIAGAILLARELNSAPRGAKAVPLLLLAGAVAALASAYYGNIYRDSPPSQLTASFKAPRLRGVRSTPERVRAVDGLFDYLAPRLSPGERLLVYDSFPMLYFILDARPAYGLSWAKQYRMKPEALRELAAEFERPPMPRYAVRAITDPAFAGWPRDEITPFQYDSTYPLNKAVTDNYVLEKTLYPFEVWRLKEPPR
jgi:hypothetical protein